MSKSLLEHSGQISILKKEASKIVLLCNSGARNRVLFLRNKRPHRHVQLFNGLKVKSQFLFHVEAVIYAIFCVCVNSVQFRKSNLSNIENGTERNVTLRYNMIRWARSKPRRNKNSELTSASVVPQPVSAGSGGDKIHTRCQSVWRYVIQVEKVQRAFKIGAD